ncbi:acyl-CoA carboxylase subunit epsilon [Agromyces sp. CFH 90414]|uniref:Acyl-CoA carboxylase subunit epsilon n=1 Tax=Agromyces agglutinans TaxID=2662258 RepID=A0A6I2F6Z6_9MICO|nr:acyl-CoA carboxylase epsilon subunit [Agromyces agglutinans]MRG60532.1 acyl-CoA carboxylase subunit epsilon [Agromyces agglutinans]
MTDEPQFPDIRFLTPVDAEEAAATTAVLAAAIAAAPAVTEAAPSRDDRRWVRAGGAIRMPLTAGPGRWNSLGR